MSSRSLATLDVASPWVAPAAVSWSLPDRGRVASLAPMRILIVDDEAPIRELLRVVCAEEGYEARTACSVQEAERLWRAWTPDCILLDLIMPGEPGTELVRRIRSTGDTTHIVIVSGDPRPDWLARVRRFGITAVIEKPFRVAQIVELLRSVRAAS